MENLLKEFMNVERVENLEIKMKENFWKYRRRRQTKTLKSGLMINKKKFDASAGYQNWKGTVKIWNMITRG